MILANESTQVQIKNVKALPTEILPFKQSLINIKTVRVWYLALKTETKNVSKLLLVMNFEFYATLI